MKAYKLLLLSLLFGGTSLVAQEKPSKNQKAEIEVAGVCNMCKKRIEAAALIPGVKTATWDKNSSILSLIYNDRKIDEKDIHEAIAKAGHDTNKQTASDSSYAALPGCCAYRSDEVHKH